MVSFVKTTTTKRNKMKERSYVLLFDTDLITSSIITLSIYKNQPTSSIYQVSTTYEALKLLDRISSSKSEPGYKHEVYFIVDLNMDQQEGYRFLTSLETHKCVCPIRVCIVNDETWTKTDHPTIKHYKFAARFDKMVDLELVDLVFNDSPPQLFQEKRSSRVGF